MEFNVSIWWEKHSIKDSMFETTYLLFSAYLLFLMQLAYAMFCAGSVNIRANNVILANVVAIVGSLSFYLFGFTFAFAGNLNSFLSLNHMSFFLFQWAFAVATASIASGSIAGRTSFSSHLIFSFFLTGFVYPVVAHWLWSTHGWLSPTLTESSLLFGSGAIDFAGSGVVHLMGGIAGLWGSFMGLPRVMGRLMSSTTSGKAAAPSPMILYRATTMVVLVLILLQFGFNLTDSFAKIFLANPTTTNQGNWILLSRTATVTMLTVSTAAITTLLGQRFLMGDWDVIEAGVGLLGGFVAISSGCSVVEPWAGVVCGFVAAFVLIELNILTLKLQVDDPLEAVQLYGGCGAWGLIFTGLFANKEFIIQAYNISGESGVTRPFGLLMGGGWGLLGAQVVELLVIVGWVSITMGPLFYILHKLTFMGTAYDEEITSLDDTSTHGGCVYIQSDENYDRYHGRMNNNDPVKDVQHSYGFYSLM